MCGILLVKSQSTIPLERHLQAFVKLQSRGPDFCRYDYKNNIFIGQAVLHITGSADYYHTVHKNFLAYNGEIYNYQDLGNYTNDIEFVDDCVNNDIDRLKLGWGPWAWAWTDGNTVLYASDPQGERTLYQYQDTDILIVCSEVAPILEYVKAEKVFKSYTSRHWTILDQTPYQGITRITAGQLYQDGHNVKNIDNIWSWINPTPYNNIDEAYEDFAHTWAAVTQRMTPNCPAALTYSGGLDSGIILSHIDNLELYTTNMTGKDYIVDRINNFLTDAEWLRLNNIGVNEERWANAFKELVARTHMPVQSWSFVGQWIVSQRCQERVLFTGVGADELFGGYAVYQHLNYSSEESRSPYSQGLGGSVWQRCLSAYNQHPGQATLLADYLYQIAGCDARGIDTIAGSWGIEARNPFLAKPIMQLALNLPFEYKVGRIAKPLIRRLFLERWTEKDILPKIGFSGHCNDSLPWLGIEIEPTGNRDQDWRQIVFKSFYTGPNQPEYRTTLE
jgi:asparagine synthetase B (glutamine-hydrolysing)